jgi:hypothetical protein
MVLGATMTKSKPFDLITIFKQLWEAHPRNIGRIYGRVKRDFSAAKDLIDLNDWDELLAEIEPRFKLFMESNFDGWKEANYPAYGLFTQWNRYIPKARPRPRKVMIECGVCEQTHAADEQCKVMK